MIEDQSTLDAVDMRLEIEFLKALLEDGSNCLEAFELIDLEKMCKEGYEIPAILIQCILKETALVLKIMEKANEKKEEDL
jgi:hypothetical protein